HELVRAVATVTPKPPLFVLEARFQAAPPLAAIPLMSAAGLEGVVSRTCLDAIAACGDPAALGREPCIAFADRAPLRAEVDLDLSALAAILVESDARRPPD